MSSRKRLGVRLQHRPRKLSAEPLHRNAHAPRASLIRPHSKPALHLPRLILPHVLRRPAQSHEGRCRCRCEHLCRGRARAMVQFRARVCFVARDDEASRREHGRRHEEWLRIMLLLRRRGKRRIGVLLCTRRGARAGLWDDHRGRAGGCGQLGSTRGCKFVDLGMLECAVLGRVAASRPCEARRVFYICSPSALRDQQTRITRTGYDVSGMEVSARVRVWANALNVAPTVRAFATDRTLLVNGNINCDLVELVATERRRAGRRAARRAFQRRDPSQLGIMNAIRRPNKVTHHKYKAHARDSQAAIVAPRTPAPVQREVSAGRRLVGHIALFRGVGRDLRVFGHNCRTIGALIQGRWTVWHGRACG